MISDAIRIVPDGSAVYTRVTQKPMFEQIVGHHRIKAQLERDIVAGKLHQSYLFAGPEHVGKMALLRELMSQVRTGQPFAAESVFGQQVLSGQGPGLMGFWDDGESLKVEQVRQIGDFISKRTEEGQWTFCVIEHVERMTTSAANAFLKNLEEPSQRVVYLMTTKEERKLLPTIRSRVQLFRFAPVPAKEVEAFLHQDEHNEVTIQEVMKLAVGRIGLAVSLLEDETLLDRLRELYDYAMLVLEKDLVDRFQLADHLSAKEVTEAERSQFLVYLALKLQQEGVDRYLGPLDRIQEVKQLLSDTQANKRLLLEDLLFRV